MYLHITMLNAKKMISKGQMLFIQFIKLTKITEIEKRFLVSRKREGGDEGQSNDFKVIGMKVPT